MKKTSLPEVDWFEKMAEELAEFKRKYAGFYGELEILAERYNAAHEMAHKAVASKCISCGPFQLAGKPTVKFNADKALEVLGEAAFRECGGTSKQITVYEVDKTQMELACASGLIDPESVKAIRTVVPRYFKPNKVVLP